jgi:hypothetical protein
LLHPEGIDKEEESGQTTEGSELQNPIVITKLKQAYKNVVLKLLFP